MDIWEANSISAAYTPHPCQATGLSVCTGATCETAPGSRYASVCDPDGCDFNSYRMGNTGFYGPGKTIDTTSKFTVVTQFITSTGTASGTLTEIRRFYVQNGVTIANSQSTISGVTGNSITDAFCTAQKTAFGDTNQFGTKGGLATMGQSLARGHVLVLSIWDDNDVSMLWLDSDYPTTADATKPGIARGTCATSSGVPSAVEAAGANVQVIYSNIKFGDIGSTFTPLTGTGGTTTKAGTTTTKAGTTTTKAGTTTTKAATTTSKTTTAGGATQTHYGQVRLFQIEFRNNSKLFPLTVWWNWIHWTHHLRFSLHLPSWQPVLLSGMR
jgi:cellulose 1,4-beta-cellobiosidase